MKFIRRKKKGFTLIELLAVIVVLTVISMIGYTLVGNVISTSKTQANKISLKEYARAITSSKALYEAETGNSLGSEQSLSKEWIEENVKYNNAKVQCEQIINGTNVNLINCQVNDDTDKYCYVNDNIYVNEECDKYSSKIVNGTIVYFNPETGKQCNDYIEGKSEEGTASGCMRWYAYNDDLLNIKLLLDHNTVIAYKNISCDLIPTRSTSTNKIISGNLSLKQAIYNELGSYAIKPTNWIDEIEYSALSIEEIERITGQKMTDEPNMTEELENGSKWLLNIGQATMADATLAGNLMARVAFSGTPKNTVALLSTKSNAMLMKNSAFDDDEVLAWFTDTLGYFLATQMTYESDGSTPTGYCDDVAIGNRVVITIPRKPINQ